MENDKAGVIPMILAYASNFDYGFEDVWHHTCMRTLLCNYVAKS